MKLTLFLLLFWALILTVTAQNPDARVTSEPCPQDLLQPADSELRCSRLHVAQDRTLAGSPEISIFIVQLPARQENGNSPIIYLAGGPGDAASADIDWWLNSRLRDAHDIILLDQRGSGRSRPSLNCHELDASDSDERLDSCHKRLIDAGFDLAAYTAESIAQDIADLIAAMQLDRVNLFARSYGARPALLLARKLPQQIRAMALDSAYTGAESALQGAAANTQRSLQRLFADCRADASCHSAYPQLAAQLSRAAATLDAKPVAVAGILPNALLQLDGDSFAHLLRNMLADANTLPYVPALIAAVAAADYDDLAFLARILPGPESLGSDSHSEGLFFSALCADETALTSAAEIEASAEGLPSVFLPLLESALDLLADCESWLDARSGISFEPPPEAIPTLYLAGAYDPIAPIAPAVTAVTVLPESPLVWSAVFPHLGHGVLEYETCAAALMSAFLADPAQPPSVGCMEELGPPDFFIRENE